jgi:hypothetical protein
MFGPLSARADRLSSQATIAPNEATEWLQYAQRLTGFVTEVVEETDELKGKEMATVLTVIDALMRRGLDCAMQAHTQMVREQLRVATGVLAAT